MSKKVAFHTLGCRLNFSETGEIAQGFSTRNFEIVPFGMKADVVFLNTCTVTDGADSSCRNLIRKAQKSSPGAKIVVAGCYAQMESEQISKMDGVDLILGTSEKYKVFDYLDGQQEQVVKIDKLNEFWGAATSLAEGHTRAFLKIQDGCNYVCSFCIIPFARGRSRTIVIDEAIRQCQELVKQGFKEVVLTGVNIGEYESSSGQKLSTLVKKILEVEGLERLRLSSVEPNTITDDLLEVFRSSDKFMDHFHIPLQSGDDEILKSMRRKYTVEEYTQVINKIKAYFPNASIGADVICGYPGETQEQFQNTYNLMKDLPMTHFHVFPYSSRKGTTASKLEDQVPSHIKKERVLKLRELGELKLRQLARSMVNHTWPVLIEKKSTDLYFEGLTPNFVRVKIKRPHSNDDYTNTIQSVFIEKLDEDEGPVGQILQ